MFKKKHDQPYKWEIFHVPSSKAVLYYNILSRKRELKLIHGCDTEHLQLSKIHSCKIIEDLNLSHEHAHIFIFFVGDKKINSNLSLDIISCRENIMHVYNSLLIFLKLSGKNIFYLLIDDCLYIQSKISDCWTLFYDAYNFLLRTSIKTLLGTQFYYSFICKQLISNELVFITLLHEWKCEFVQGRSVREVEEKSVNCLVSSDHSSLIGSSCEISNTVPNVTSGFEGIIAKNDCKDVPKYIGFKTASGKNIKVSSFALNSANTMLSVVMNELNSSDSQFMKKTSSNQNPTKTSTLYKPSKLQQASFQMLEKKYTNSLKRKRFETGNTIGSVQKQPKVDLDIERKWKQFSNLKPFLISSYIDIFSKKSASTSILNNLKSSDTCILNNCRNLGEVDYASSKLSDDDRSCAHNEPLSELYHVEFSDNLDQKKCGKFPLTSVKKIDHCSSFANKNLSLKSFNKAGKSFYLKNKSSNIDSKNILCNIKNIKTADFTAACDDANVAQNRKKSLSGFKTASGNTIYASQSALISAQRIYQEILGDVEVEFVDPVEDSKKQLDSKNIASFKNINKTPPDKCSIELDEMDMDLDLAEKFFEEICFDEKDPESTNEIGSITTSLIPVPNVASTSSASTSKRKKSLGTRMNLKILPKKGES